MKPTASLAYWFMPDNLVIPIAILLFVLGIFSRFVGFRRIGNAMLVAAIGIVVLPTLLGPVVEEIILSVPPWVVVVLLVALGMYFLRLILALFLGKDGAGTLLAMLVMSGLRRLARLSTVVTRKWMPALAGAVRNAHGGRSAAGVFLLILLAVLLAIVGWQAGEGWLEEQDRPRYVDHMLSVSRPVEAKVVPFRNTRQAPIATTRKTEPESATSIYIVKPSAENSKQEVLMGAPWEPMLPWKLHRFPVSSKSCEQLL